jgi:16S rRNA pseudouridine516 synthase
MESPQLTLTPAKLIAETQLVSRRALRRQIRYLIGPDGSKLGLDASLAIGSAWQRFELRDAPFWARAARPPAVAYHKRIDEVVSHRPDGGALPVFEVLEALFPFDLLAVGRLDRETTGLLLTTTDGTLLHRLTHPKYVVERTYEVTTEAPLSDAAMAQALSGDVTLRDGHSPKPVSLTGLPDAAGRSRYALVLTEGKYHEVRRLFAALHAPVIALHRTAYGPIALGTLAPGDAARIEADDYAALYASVGLALPEAALEVAFEAPDSASSV